jgi:TetR/AcrR family transcriptional repressor of nem operon
MLPVENQKPKFAGRIGKELDGAAGREAAYVAALNTLAVARLKLVVASGVFSKPWRQGLDALSRAKTAGELADGVEPSSAARILVCFVERLRVVGKTAPTRITSQATVDALLDRFTR